MAKLNHDFHLDGNDARKKGVHVRAFIAWLRVRAISYKVENLVVAFLKKLNVTFHNLALYEMAPQNKKHRLALSLCRSLSLSRH